MGTVEGKTAFFHRPIFNALDFPCHGCGFLFNDFISIFELLQTTHFIFFSFQNLSIDPNEVDRRLLYSLIRIFLHSTNNMQCLSQMSFHK